MESVLAQTRRVAVAHISDNASTDETPQIAQALADANETVRFTRHPASLGMSGNFGFVLQQAETEYFMWLAADDIIEPTYVERTLEALEADPNLVACVTRARFATDDGTIRPAYGTYPLLADPVTNLAAYLTDPSDNTRIFGLYRTRPLQRAFPSRYFHAYDWAIAAGTLLHGRHMEIPEFLMVRDETPRAAYVNAVRRDNPTLLGRLFPVFPMTADLIRRQRIPLRWPIIKALLHTNLEMHRTYALVHHPRYGRIVDPILRNHVLWRLEAPRPK